MPKSSCKITTACAWGTISPCPFAMHNVQSPYTWTCNYTCGCLLGTSWMRTKANFISPHGWMKLARSTCLWIQTITIEGLLKLQKKNKIKEGEGMGRCTRSICTSYLIWISKPSKVGKLWLNCGPLQHLRNLLNDATRESIPTFTP